MRWIPFPFIRIVLFFILGIVLGVYYSHTSIMWIAGAFSILLLVIYFSVLRIDYRNRRITQGGIAALAVLCCGYFHTVYQTDSLHPDHIIKYGKSIEFYTVKLLKASEEKSAHWKTEAVINQVMIRGEWKKVRGKILLYFSKKDFLNPYDYGDVLLIKANPQEVQPPSNPGEFDYKRFLQFKNIYHQQFLRSGTVKRIAAHDGFKLLEWSYASRAWATALLKKHIKGSREQGLAAALVLGVNDGLDNELLQAYAASGTLHVLSVSGLHVGIVYLMIMFIFKPLNKTKTGRWILAVLSILILWAYAFITGLSPSVLRAVAMFSFVALSTPNGKRTNIYNTLAISAFCLLLYDPFLIMSVGFQLSYLAVLGIVYLQPGFYKLWEPNGRLWDEVWKVTSVSLAAQLATLSLGLLYFHQFPNYFLVSNLLVIPLSFIILIGGITLMAFSFIPYLAMWIGFAVEGLINVMNVIVLTIESFPFSRLDNIYITTLQCIVLTAIIVMLILAIQYKMPRYWYAFVALVFIFSGLQWMSFGEKFGLKKMIVYNVPHHRAIDFVDKGVAYFVIDSALYSDTESTRHHITPCRVLHQIDRIIDGREQGITRFFKGGEIIYWNGKYLVCITAKNYALPPLPTIDYLIIGNNAVKDIIMLRKQLSFKKLIIDSSNSFYFANAILKQSAPLALDIHSVVHQGAFVVTL